MKCETGKAGDGDILGVPSAAEGAVLVLRAGEVRQASFDGVVELGGDFVGEGVVLGGGAGAVVLGEGGECAEHGRDGRGTQPPGGGRPVVIAQRVVHSLGSSASLR
jgi:hypothetical protein